MAPPLGITTLSSTLEHARATSLAGLIHAPDPDILHDFLQFPFERAFVETVLSYTIQLVRSNTLQHRGHVFSAFPPLEPLDHCRVTADPELRHIVGHPSALNVKKELQRMCQEFLQAVVSYCNGKPLVFRVETGLESVAPPNAKSSTDAGTDQRAHHH